MLAEAGIGEATIEAEAGAHAVPSPEAWWAGVMGSGYRGTVDQLDAADRDRVRAINMAWIRDSGVRSVEANVVYAIAVKT